MIDLKAAMAAHKCSSEGEVEAGRAGAVSETLWSVGMGLESLWELGSPVRSL